MQKHRGKRKKFTAQLPATTCTSEMRKSVEEVCETQNLALADFVRNAVAFYLLSDFCKTKEKP